MTSEEREPERVQQNQHQPLAGVEATPDLSGDVSESPQRFGPDAGSGFVAVVRYGGGMILSKATGIAITALVGLAVTLPAVANARTQPVKNGFYSSLAGVRSSDVEFHVRSAVNVPNLSLGCMPADQNLTRSTSSANIAVVAPKLRIRNGRISYHGPAKVTLDYAGAPKIAETTLNLTAAHVNGPVHHYSFEGKRLQETTAWKGSATSPACTKLPRNGGFTLFGPVAGE
jgi:hypothetical protein